MEKTFTIELYGQTLRVTGIYLVEEIPTFDDPGCKESFECEKIELFTGIKGYYPVELYQDISQFISEINPDFYQKINKKVIEDLKDKRK